VALRLVGIGHLSFYGDEETTTLAALALLQGWPPTLPGGLVYLRGLPFTGLEALAIALLGVSELSLRLFPALLAGPRVFALWWLARPLLGARLALLAAALLILAPLDIEYSRNARMYSLFATLDLLALAALAHAALGARRALVAGACGALAITTHVAAASHAPLALLAALGRRLTPARRAAALAAGAAMVAAFLLQKSLTRETYAAAKGTPAFAHARISPLDQHLEALGQATQAPLALLAAGAGLAAALLLVPLALRRLPGWLPRLAALAGLGAGALASPALAAPLLLGALALAGIPPSQAARRAAPLLAAAALALGGWGLAGLAAHGVGAAGLEATARLLLGLPAPNWVEMALAAPLLLGLALAGAIAAAERGARSGDAAPWLVLVAAAFAPLLLSGLQERSGALRYQLHTLGPLIALALLGAHALARRLAPRPGLALGLAALASLAAVRPDLGLAVVGREHGPIETPFSDLGVAPDHRGAGAFVRARARAEEWIAAEDPLQQYLLAGRADLWLRQPEDADGFLRADPEGGPARDVYVGSRLVPDLPALQELARREGRVVWLVTSAECEARPRWYRTPETDALLRAWRPLAWFEGADGMTRVYRLVGGEPEAPVAAGEPVAPVAGWAAR
jgi:hypothetical protein